MAYTYHGTVGWIKQPNRIVKTFRSGLCMIQQDYIRRKDKVDFFTFREGDRISDQDSAPCIDGAFIFPTPEYRDTGNGFISCTVTSYGRVNTDGVVDSNRRRGDYLSTFFFSTPSGTGGSQSILSQKFFDIAIYRFTARKNEFITAPETPILFIYELNGTKLPIGRTTALSGDTLVSKDYILERQVENYESTNYGEFSEFTISVSATGSFVQNTAFGFEP